MDQQERAGIANNMEDVALLAQSRMVDRMMRRVVQRGHDRARDLHQIAQRKHAVDLEDVLMFVESELGGEHAAPRRIHPLADLESHDRGKAAVAQFGFDHREQVVGFLFVALSVGVARNAEEFAGRDLHVRKQQVKVMRDDIFQRYEMPAAPGPDKTWNAGAQGHLDTGDELFAAL